MELPISVFVDDVNGQVVARKVGNPIPESASVTDLLLYEILKKLEELGESVRAIDKDIDSLKKAPTKATKSSE